MKKMKVNKKLCNVITMDEYSENPDLYDPKFTAIETASGTVLPIKNQSEDGAGIYYHGGEMVAKVVKPTPENAAKYSSENIIDFSKPKDIGEIISKNNLVRDIENDILTTKDNIFELNIGNDDSPEMIAVKKAINTKQVDIKQYESRFTQYQNDLRLLKGKSITLGKLVSTCNNFDISAELILRDKTGCANPMNTEIHVLLTEGDE